MIEQIVPNYYAAGATITGFEVVGQNLIEWLGKDIYGYDSYINESPAVNERAPIDSNAAYKMTYVDNNRAVFRAQVEHQAANNRYLGVIVEIAGDVKTRLWLNETRPLP